MIVFDVVCSNAHRFEAWFRNSDAFEFQRERKDIECPCCGDRDVAKAPMAPRISRSGSRTESLPDPQEKATQHLAETMQMFRREIESSCDYVGDGFPEEARRIHYGEADERGIYGEASDEDASALKEEGIECHLLPSWLRRTD